MQLKVTEDVATLLKTILDSMEADPGQMIRLVSNSLGSLSVVVDSEMKEDRLVLHEGAAVMVIEPALSADLSGLTLDVEEASEGYCLTLFGAEMDKRWNAMLTPTGEVLESWREPLV